jgi:hypothetical protein
MSDGREEREEEKKRRELEEWKDREDRLNRNPEEDGTPERGGSQSQRTGGGARLFYGYFSASAFLIARSTPSTAPGP